MMEFDHAAELDRRRHSLQTDDSAAGLTLTDSVTPKGKELNIIMLYWNASSRHDFTQCFGHIAATKGGQVKMCRTSAGIPYDGIIVIM